MFSIDPIKVLDPGHKYELFSLDGGGAQTLTFVKRCDDGTKYPGNHDAYPGTTLQAVLRALIERVAYLQKQAPSQENMTLIEHLKYSNWLLERRAAARHGYLFDLTPEEVFQAGVCAVCGHVVCPRNHERT